MQTKYFDKAAHNRHDQDCYTFKMNKRKRQLSEKEEKKEALSYQSKSVKEEVLSYRSNSETSVK